MYYVVVSAFGREVETIGPFETMKEAENEIEYHREEREYRVDLENYKIIEK
jgi:hypothetical protein